MRLQILLTIFVAQGRLGSAVAVPTASELRQVNYAGQEGMWCVGLNAVGFDLDAHSGRNGAWTVPDRAALQHFHDQGSNCFRLPVTWERLQSQLGVAELSLVDQYAEIVDYITDVLGDYVIIDPHNNDQGLKYNNVDATRADFVKLWMAIAKKWKNNKRTIFGLYNEPRYGQESGIDNYFDPDAMDLSGQMIEHWRQWMQDAIDAIRQEGATNLILVPGLHWTTCRDWGGANWWGENLDGNPHAGNTRLAALTDPGVQNIAYDVHQYMDGSFTGTADGCAGHTDSKWGGPGADWGLAQTILWAQKYNKKLMMTEIGSWPSDGTHEICKTKMSNYLQQMFDSGVFIGYQVWQFGCPQCDGDLWSKWPLNHAWYRISDFGGNSGDPVTQISTSQITSCSEANGDCATTQPQTTTPSLPCSGANEGCSATKCCKDEGFTCFEKNAWWAQCRDSCTPGIDPNDDPQYQTPWTCTALTSSGPATTVTTTKLSTALTSSSPSTAVTTTTIASSSNIVFENAAGVGGWGGSCTCPDGTQYQVGDNGDACGSLACVGGTSGACQRSLGAWSNRKVVCTSSNTNTIIENAAGVGGWGGVCTCPDGAEYQVGDNGDACGSLACVGGASGTCRRSLGAWSNRKVVCASPSTNIVTENAAGVGGWGGACTCPDGTQYQVGDNGDACGSLACVGGSSSECQRSLGAWSNRKVVCAGIGHSGGRRLAENQTFPSLGIVLL